ncbi:MAG TPA: hypothetical protein VKS24_24855 [Bradyrhizobium sp.]|nr:hypothetical protein [Bradyrhizobium sp.]
MGYRSLVQSIGQLSRIGMPYGWDSQAVNWSEDETTTEYDRNEIPWRTTHIKREIDA